MRRIHVTIDLISLGKGQGEPVDYDLMLFRLGLPERLDTENSRDALLLLQALRRGGAKKVLLDLSVLQYVDSAGIGVLIAAAKEYRANRCEMALSGVTREVRNVFKMINLQGFIRVFNLEAEAVNYFRYLSGPPRPGAG
ncbi:MAG: STAS domain-containing protein [Spirochaetes bacterium]|nr:STAS domain-containing protein [Spirochaetota bacterium]